MITNKSLEEISLENKTQKISFDAITDAESDATPARHASFLFFSHNFQRKVISAFAGGRKNVLPFWSVVGS